MVFFPVLVVRALWEKPFKADMGWDSPPLLVGRTGESREVMGFISRS